MTGTLESILNGVRSVKNRLSDAVFAAAKTAKRVLAPVKHPLTLTALLATLSPSFAQQNANAEVLLTMEARNSLNIPMRFWMPNGQTLKLFVYADNTLQTEATSGIEWELKAPPQLSFMGFRRPSPYITLSSSEPNSATNDFFYPSSMDSSSNYVTLPGQKNSRFTARINGGPQRAQISHRKGWLGIYYFEVPRNCPLGDYKFEIINPRAEGPNGETQEGKGTKMTVRVLQDVRSLYKYPTNQSMVLIDINDGVPYTHASENWNQLQLEASTDLENWEILKVNDNQNSPGVKPYWNSFDYIDTRVSGYNPIRFYRARTVTGR